MGVAASGLSLAATLDPAITSVVLANGTAPPIQSTNSGNDDSASSSAVTGTHAFSLLSGRVWSLARDAQGCREVQNALVAAQTEEERLAIAMELQNHVWDAIRCPYANYVLQKCITVLKPQSSQFIFDEVVSKGVRRVAQVAKHKYGCRILQRLLELRSSPRVRELAEALLADAINTSRHQYGNYVMQHLLEHGSREQRASLIRQLARHAPAVGADEFACSVVSKAMAHGDRDDQVSLARALVNVPGTVSYLSRSRHGHSAVELLLQVLDGEDHEKVRCQIRVDAAALRSSRYGRIVLAAIDPAAQHHTSSAT